MKSGFPNALERIPDIDGRKNATKSALIYCHTRAGKEITGTSGGVCL